MALYSWSANTFNVTNDLLWSDRLNWSPNTGPPGASDNVTLQGYYGELRGQPADIDGAGAAYQMAIGGPVEFYSDFDVTVGSNATLSEGSVLTIDAGAQWQVTGDLNLYNTYNSGYGVDVTTYGSVDVSGTLGVTWASDVQVGSPGTLSVGAIATGPGGSAGYNALTLGVAGVFEDDGQFIVGGASAIIGSGNGTVTIAGPATLDGASIDAEGSSHVSVDSVLSSNNSDFKVGSQTAWLAVGASGASAGQFYLGGNLLTYGGITAPSIVIGGQLEVKTGSSEELSGTLSGGGNLQIDANAVLIIDDAPLASATSTTITFANSSGTLDLGSDVFDGSSFLAPEIKDFTAGNVIDLEGFTNAKVVNEQAGSNGDVDLTVSGQVNGTAADYELAIQGPQPEQLIVSPVMQYGGTTGTFIKYTDTNGEYDWTGDGDTNEWSDAGNWYDLTTDQPAAEAPGAGDAVVFGELAGGSATFTGPGGADGLGLGTAVTFANGADIVAEEVIEASNANTTVDYGATLTVSDYFNADSSVSLTVGGAVTIGTQYQVSSDDTITVDQGATLDVGENFNAASGSNVDLTVDGGMSVGGQFLEGMDADTTIASGATLGVISSFVAGPDGTLTVGGHMIVVGQLTQASGQTIAVSGSLTVAAIVLGADVSGDTYNVTGGVIQDDGDFSGNGDTIHLLPGQFNVTGTSTLTGVTLTASYGGVFDTGSGTFSSDFITAQGGLIEVNADLSSTDDNIDLSSGGTLTITGTATLTKDTTFTIDGTSSFSAQDAIFSGDTITNDGLITISGNLSSTGDAFAITGGGSGGSVTDDTSDSGGGTGGTSTDSLSVGGTATLTNDTDFTLGEGATFSAQDGIFSGNTITANGVIAISGNLSSTGDTIAVTSDSSGTPETETTSDDSGDDSGGGSVPSFTVGGTVTLTNDGSVTIGDTATFAAQTGTLSGNTITVNGSVDFTGDLSSTGDTIDVAGDTSGATFTAGGTATLAGDTIYVSSGTVTLSAIANQTDTQDQQDNSYQVNDTGSWIEIGGAGDGQGGDFIVDSGQTLSGGGEIAAFSIVINGTVEVQSGDGEQFVSPLSGDGTIQIDNGATVQVDTAEASSGVPTIDFNGSGGVLTLWPEALSSNTLASTIDGFTAGDTIDIQGLSDDTVTYAVNGDGNLVATIGGADQLTFAGDALDGDLTASPDNSGGAFVETSVTCFRDGTRLRTPGGEVAVESLRAGDLVVTIAGTERPIRWVGHRKVKCVNHPDPRQVQPIRVSAGALGLRQPARDLFLSPDHAVLTGGTLIPIKYLANGTTIAQLPVDEVNYYHVELDQHDIVSAEGVPCESYLDVGDRANFSNGGATMRLFPDFSDRPPSIAASWETRGCAPLVVTGPRLEAARAMLTALTPRQAG